MEDRHLKVTYADFIFYTDKMAGEDVAVIQVDNGGVSAFELKPKELDEFIKALQEAKEVLARGRNTDE